MARLRRRPHRLLVLGHAASLVVPGASAARMCATCSGIGVANVDDDRVGGLFERRELAVEQRRRHVAVLPRGEPRRDRRAVALEIDEADVARGPRTRRDPVAVGRAQRRAREHGVAVVRLHRGDLRGERVEPGPAVGVGQRRARRHLRDVLRGMKIVAVEERPAQLARRARGRPTILPDPDTPITTTIIGPPSPSCMLPAIVRRAPRCYRVIADPPIDVTAWDSASPGTPRRRSACRRRACARRGSRPGAPAPAQCRRPVRAPR